MSTIFRSKPIPGSSTPKPIDLYGAEMTAVIVLADSTLVADSAWISYIKEIAKDTKSVGLRTRVFPITFGTSVLKKLALTVQALRWDRWRGTLGQREQKLARELTYEFCRMLRYSLRDFGKSVGKPGKNFGAYLRKIQIFLSHSKSDKDGEKIAHLIRDRIHKQHGSLASFLDVKDIPVGMRFSRVLLEQIRSSAMVAIHTDTYSSREWCRREIIEAKINDMPLVVVTAINDLDTRGFPYMGNVPIIQIEPRNAGRLDFVIGCLLDEMLKDFLWRLRMNLVCGAPVSGVSFISRPPELISLTRFPSNTPAPVSKLVYPDPPISSREKKLFEKISPHIRLYSFNEWVALV